MMSNRCNLLSLNVPYYNHQNKIFTKKLSNLKKISKFLNIGTLLRTKSSKRWFCKKESESQIKMEMPMVIKNSLYPKIACWIMTLIKNFQNNSIVIWSNIKKALIWVVRSWMTLLFCNSPKNKKVLFLLINKTW